jgi:AhpD family alkylhydroperoxidase
MEPRLQFAKASPEAVRALGALDQRIAKASLEPALVEMVRLRTSQINGCSYCIDLHTKDARKAGVSERALALLPVWREAPMFDDRERAAFAWTEAVTQVADGHVPDAVWEQIKPHFTPEEIVDLTLLIVSINAWNRFGIAFRKLPE